MTWLSTHPAHGDRISRVNGLVAKLESPPKGGRDAAALEKVKARIRALPPLPPRKPKDPAQPGTQPGQTSPGSGSASPTKQVPKK
jgi:predicted Zn-dependent protease